MRTKASSFATPSPSPNHRTTTLNRRHPDRASQETKVTFCVRGVISPLLANIYLHYVYDLWVQRWRKHLVWLFQRLRRWNLGQPRHARGAMIVVRYADDTVVGFEHQADAERFLAHLRVRLGEFALELHPEKTRADRVRQACRA